MRSFMRREEHLPSGLLSTPKTRAPPGRAPPFFANQPSHEPFRRGPPPLSGSPGTAAVAPRWRAKLRRAGSRPPDILANVATDGTPLIRSEARKSFVLGHGGSPTIAGERRRLRPQGRGRLENVLHQVGATLAVDPTGLLPTAQSCALAHPHRSGMAEGETRRFAGAHVAGLLPVRPDHADLPRRILLAESEM